MNRIARLIALSTFLLPNLAAAAAWDIDAAHSSVGFSVAHMMVSTTKGQFKTFGGAVDFDPKAPEKASIKVDIDVASVDTQNAKRDEHLKAPDFFDAAKFPKMTFASKKVEKAGAGKYKVTGDLSLHGVTKEVVLDVSGLDAAAKNPFTGKETRGASATAKINRKDFGLTWNKAIETGGVMVGEEIAIQIEVELAAK